MTSPLSLLTPEDRAALSKSADDLSDIDGRRLARIDEEFGRAYETARGIGNDSLNPLTH